MTAPSPGVPVAADAAPMNRLAGCDRELHVLQDAVARPGDGTHVVVIRGEAGIGKSTLWRAGVAHARRRGAVTLVARAAEVDTFRTMASGDVPLTPTESRISDLVAGGRRNREIAGELAISVATVEVHLTRISRKLHIRSRTELARDVRSA